jgi:hypothetical protein
MFSGCAVRIWIMVSFGEIAVDGGLEIEDGSEYAALGTPLGESTEEAFERIEPGARGRR